MVPPGGNVGHRFTVLVSFGLLLYSHPKAVLY